MVKTAVITGGSRGIGAAMTRVLGKLGCNTVINYTSDHSKVLTEELAHELETTYGVRAEAVRADVSDYDQCARLVDTAVSDFGPIDALICNAGINNGINFIDIRPEQYERLIAVNLVSIMHMTHLVLPHMVDHADREHQCVINYTSSIDGLDGFPNQADYCASKAGVIGFMRSIAREYAGRGIRANVIAPGLTMTDMLRGVDPDEIAGLAAKVPLGTIGDVSDIAGALEYLLTAPYMTGQVISPNGGLIEH